MTTATQTVFDIIRAAVDKSDGRFHRRMSGYYLKEYIKDATDIAEMTEEKWNLYADACSQMVTRRKEEAIEMGMRAIESAVNGDDKDLVMQAMRRVHPHLFNEIIGAAFQVVKDHHMRDGRISGIYKTVAEEHFFTK